MVSNKFRTGLIANTTASSKASRIRSYISSLYHAARNRANQAVMPVIRIKKNPSDEGHQDYAVTLAKRFTSICSSCRVTSRD